MRRIHDSVPFQLDEAESADAFVRPFCLEEAPLFRAALVKESDERHLLLTDMHHIISDGVSVNTLIKNSASCTQAVRLRRCAFNIKTMPSGAVVSGERRVPEAGSLLAEAA
ncbi:condensation domain-containing protein [Bacillus velezensis]|nr:condensation domain-containing protein [Bacillus velezensis]